MRLVVATARLLPSKSAKTGRYFTFTRVFIIVKIEIVENNINVAYSVFRFSAVRIGHTLAALRQASGPA